MVGIKTFSKHLWFKFSSFIVTIEFFFKKKFIIKTEKNFIGNLVIYISNKNERTRFKILRAYMSGTTLKFSQAQMALNG